MSGEIKGSKGMILIIFDNLLMLIGALVDYQKLEEKLILMKDIWIFKTR